MSAPHVDEALCRATAMGMHQHPEEIRQLADFLASAHGSLRDAFEIGTLHGGTALLWRSLIEGTVATIDLPDGLFGGHDCGFTMAKCLTRRHKMTQHNVLSLLADSHDRQLIDPRLKMIFPTGVDFVFIDGDHTEAGVRQDLDLALAFVRPGGYIVFHDINDTAFHREAGCMVAPVWQSLKTGHKWEFSERRAWGGIGVWRPA